MHWKRLYETATRPTGAQSMVQGPTASLMSEARMPTRNNFGSSLPSTTKSMRSISVPGRAELEVGADDWPLPIPIVESGQWAFDTNAGA